MQIIDSKQGFPHGFSKSIQGLNGRKNAKLQESQRVTGRRWQATFTAQGAHYRALAGFGAGTRRPPPPPCSGGGEGRQKPRAVYWRGGGGGAGPPPAVL